MNKIYGKSDKIQRVKRNILDVVKYNTLCKVVDVIGNGSIGAIQKVGLIINDGSDLQGSRFCVTFPAGNNKFYLDCSDIGCNCWIRLDGTYVFNFADDYDYIEVIK